MFNRNDQPQSAARALRLANLDESIFEPETHALRAMIRSHIDDIVARAQKNVGEQRGPAGFGRAVVFARGGANPRVLDC